MLLLSPERLYQATIIVSAMAITALGPLIPFLPTQQHDTPTYYTFLFLSHSIGYLIGQQAYVGEYTHKSVGFSFLLCVFAIPFTYVHSLVMKGIMIMMFSIGTSFTNAAIKNITEQQGISPASCERAFLFGCIVAQGVVYFCGADSYLLISLCGLLLFSLLYMMPPPSHVQLHCPLTQHQEPSLPTTSMRMLGAMYCLMIGQVCTFTGWVPSYAVMNGHTATHAIVYTFVFWTVTALARGAIAAWGTPPPKVLTLALALAGGCCLLSLVILAFGFQVAALLLPSMVLALSNSLFFSLVYKIPRSYQYSFTFSQHFAFLSTGFFGEGSITVLVGTLMNLYTPHFLFYSLFFIHLLLLFALVFFTRTLSATQTSQRQDHQLKPLY